MLSELYARQIDLLEGRACQQYMHGIDLLNMSVDKVPQLPDINAVLQETTGWQTAEVPALIPFGEFFRLLANKHQVGIAHSTEDQNEVHLVDTMIE
mgnify:CR=1 FL=1